MQPKDINKLRRDITFHAKLHGADFVFHSTWGLFSPKKIDEGSRLLIESVEVKPNDSILDLGCGYGALGITLAKLAPKGKTHMVDKDFVAIEYAKKNAEANDIKDAKIYLPNGFSHVPEDERFDLIVSNLPAKASKELFAIMFADAKARLAPGGRIYVVTIAGLKDYIKRSFRETFGNWKKAKQGRGHIVSMAELS